MTQTPSVASESPRTAIVTGASSGLGVAIARGLGALGWRVAVGARRLERLQETAQEIEEAGGRAFAHRLDVADPESVDGFFDAVEAEFGLVDVVVNITNCCATYGQRGWNSSTTHAQKVNTHTRR